MEKIGNIIQLLNESNINWRNILLDIIDDNETEQNEEITDLIKKLILEVRNIIKVEHKQQIKLESIIASVDKFISDEELTKKLVEYTYNTLKPYFLLKPLRDWEHESIDLAKGRILEIFDNLIERFDVEFTNKCKIYGFDNSEDFKNFLNIIDQITSFYVTKHFTVKAIKNDIKEEVDLGDELCDFYATQVNTRYSNLLNNLLLDKLNSVLTKTKYITNIFEKIKDEDE